jgi:triosephosphate isomerase
MGYRGGPDGQHQRRRDDVSGDPGKVERFSGARAAASIRLQYGGSVTPETAGALLAAENVDGLLVGAESLDAAQFFGIVSARD